jgi:hypothetical protein
LDGYEAYRRTRLAAAQVRRGPFQFEPTSDHEARDP